MNHDVIMQEVKDYIAAKILDGKDVGLDAQTPLLEWGILNSIEIMRLFTYIREQFQVDISPKQMVASNFSDLEAITNLIERSKSGDDVLGEKQVNV